jgi:serine phosphatase RsbU (regulator of sigma subunit)
MMGINLLNNIIIERGISNPALILDIMREEIILKLNPEGSVEEAKDGMDMVLCKLDIKNRELEYAAANNSLYILRNGELTEYKGDKMPVGKYSETAESFTKHKVKLEKGDILYSFTDGYPDQFGGEKGKKFKYKQLEELLISSGTKPMTAQKRLFEKTIKTWKGDFEQVDDILMIGIKVD